MKIDLQGDRRFPLLCCLSQRHVYQMLTQEPCLKLVGSEYLADKKIVSA
jgi:hypothetical protein